MLGVARGKDEWDALFGELVGVAAALNVPRTRIERIAREEKPVTADTALRLGKFFNTGPAFWMNMQARFDLETAEDLLAPQIKKIAPYETV